jgi:hypothetical protein
VCAVIVAGVLSGQIVPSTRTMATEQAPVNARTLALQALDVVDRRVESVALLVDSGNEDAHRACGDLLARSRTIRERVETLDPDDENQRGAWAGLRASVADLEYHSDVLLLVSRSTTMGFSAGAEPTIAETLATLEEVRATLDDQGRLDHAVRLDRMQTEVQRLRVETADDAPTSAASEAARTAWARRLATLRRELRSISRQQATRNAVRASR